MTLSATIAKWRKKVERLCLAFPEARAIMEEMPGMKSVVAGLVMGELGSPQRFHSAKAYAKATGLTRATLHATMAGAPVYDRIGYRKVANIGFYGLKS